MSDETSRKHDGQRPRVSIGLPVFNGEAYLRKAITSLLEQTFQDFELIISDNASTDSTHQIASVAAKRDSRVKYFRQTANLGAIENFNWVFAVARGEYFKWAAHDDYCAPTFLERCVERLDANPDAVWCHCDSDQVDGQGKSLFPLLASQPPGRHPIQVVRQDDGTFRRPDHPRQNSDSPRPHLRFDGVLRGTTWSVDSYGVIRSEALQSTRLLRPIYGGEKVLMGELALRGPYTHVSELLFFQRVHAGASSWTTSVAKQREFTGMGSDSPLRRRLRLIVEHYRAVMSTRLRALDRLRCLAVLAGYVLQFEKWPSTLMSRFTRRGLGGDVGIWKSATPKSRGEGS